MARVLVVEDDNDIREVLVEALTDDGYGVEWANNGLAGLRRVQLRPPQLVILDLMIPGLDGLGFIRECRQDPRCAELNVIVVSAHPGERIGEIDAQAVMQKPFNLPDLLDKVAELAPATADNHN